MSAALMGERIAKTSPRLKARIAGGLYLVVVVGGLFAEGFVRSSLVVPGDTAATAHNIMTHEFLYRLGLAIHLSYLLCNIPLAVIFYDLFKVVNRNLSWIVVFFMLVGTAIEAVNLLNQFAPLILLEGGRYARVFTPEHLQVQAYIPL